MCVQRLLLRRLRYNGNNDLYENDKIHKNHMTLVTLKKINELENSFIPKCRILIQDSVNI